MHVSGRTPEPAGTLCFRQNSKMLNRCNFSLVLQLLSSHYTKCFQPFWPIVFQEHMWVLCAKKSFDCSASHSASALWVFIGFPGLYLVSKHWLKLDRLLWCLWATVQWLNILEVFGGRGDIRRWLGRQDLISHLVCEASLLFLKASTQQRTGTENQSHVGNLYFLCSAAAKKSVRRSLIPLRVERRKRPVGVILFIAPLKPLPRIREAVVSAFLVQSSMFHTSISCHNPLQTHTHSDIHTQQTSCYAGLLNKDTANKAC